MPKLTNMKMTKAETDEKYSVVGPSPDAPRYPWGLVLNLDEEILDKLGIAPPAVDAKMIVLARAVVTSVSSSQSEGGEKRRSVTLQITDLGVEPDSAKTLEKASSTLYGE